MNDKPEAVAWRYSKPGCAEEWFTDPWPELIERGWTETPLYAHPPSQPDVSALEQALRDVLNPVGYLKRYAEQQGCQIDGGMAVMMAQDIGFVKGIARAALTAWEAQHG